MEVPNVKLLHSSGMKEVYTKYGCNTFDMVAQMYEEQKEHNYANLTTSYVKVSECVF